MSLPPNSLPPAQRNQMVDLAKVKNFLTGALLKGINSSDRLIPEQRRQVAYQSLAQIYSRTGLQLPEDVREKLFREVLDELTGFGPIQPLLDDPDVSEVMVNGPKNVYVERKGKVTRTDVPSRTTIMSCG